MYECPWDGALSAGYSASVYLDECCDGVNLDVIYTPSTNSLCPPQIVASVSYNCADFCGCLDWAACNYDSSALFDDVGNLCDYESCCTEPTACNFQAPGGCEYLDVLGICAGNCFSDIDADGICDDIDDCVGEIDVCGVQWRLRPSRSLRLRRTSWTSVESVAVTAYQKARLRRQRL